MYLYCIYINRFVAIWTLQNSLRNLSFIFPLFDLLKCLDFPIYKYFKKQRRTFHLFHRCKRYLLVLVTFRDTKLQIINSKICKFLGTFVKLFEKLQNDWTFEVKMNLTINWSHFCLKFGYYHIKSTYKLIIIQA